MMINLNVFTKLKIHKSLLSLFAVTYHLANHHDIGSEVFVDPKNIQHADVPEDDVHAVYNPAIAHVRFRL